MRQTWFTADTHCGHGNIIKYCNRPFLAAEDVAALEANDGQWHDGSWRGEFSSDHRISREAIDQMDEELIDQINQRVDRNDELYLLGDFCLAGKRDPVGKAASYRDRIRCRNVHLIFGNHDNRMIGDLFSSASDYQMINARGQRIVLSHYAMAVWNQSHRGAWQLYGHSHGGAESWMDAQMPGRRSMDVGVDNAKKLLGEYRPFSFDELQSIMSQRNGFSMDHHVPTNYQGPSEEELIDGLSKE